ncbi:LPXTG cell wall anchor domain-containing protein [Aminobacterium mobile]
MNALTVVWLALGLLVVGGVLFMKKKRSNEETND